MEDLIMKHGRERILKAAASAVALSVLLGTPFGVSAADAEPLRIATKPMTEGRSLSAGLWKASLKS